MPRLRSGGWWAATVAVVAVGLSASCGAHKQGHGGPRLMPAQARDHDNRLMGLAAGITPVEMHMSSLEPMNLGDSEHPVHTVSPNVLLVEPLVRLNQLGETDQLVRLFCGAPGTSTEGSLIREENAAWDRAELRLSDGAALAVITKAARPSTSTTNTQTSTPVMPIIIFEDIETGADGTLLIVWAKPLPDASAYYYVGLQRGGPARLRIPDDPTPEQPTGTHKDVYFTLLGTARSALRIKVEPRSPAQPEGPRKYTLTHVLDGTVTHTIYNDWAGPSGLSGQLDARPLTAYSDPGSNFLQVVNSYKTLIDRLGLN